MLENINNEISRFEFLSGNTLKIIAFASMICDHFAKIVLFWWFYSMYYLQYKAGAIAFSEIESLYNLIIVTMPAIGRLAFPIFCFFIVEGFIHTKNRTRYMVLMGIFAVVSELPFDLAFYAFITGEMYNFVGSFIYQNVLFTMLIGLFALLCIEKIQNSDMKIQLQVLLQALAIFAFASLADLCKTDYASEGVLFIVAFYLLKDNRIFASVSHLVIYALYELSVPPIMYFVATALILLYNGKRGKLKMKYFFYIFYPAHLAIFYAIVYFSGWMGVL